MSLFPWMSALLLTISSSLVYELTPDNPTTNEAEAYRIINNTKDLKLPWILNADQESGWLMGITIDQNYPLIKVSQISTATIIIEGSSPSNPDLIISFSLYFDHDRYYKIGHTTTYNVPYWSVAIPMSNSNDNMMSPQCGTPGNRQSPSSGNMYWEMQSRTKSRWETAGDSWYTTKPINQNNQWNLKFTLVHQYPNSNGKSGDVRFDISNTATSFVTSCFFEAVAVNAYMDIYITTNQTAAPVNITKIKIEYLTTIEPTNSPTTATPTSNPIPLPTNTPTTYPPTMIPSNIPTLSPTYNPTTIHPTNIPSLIPTNNPLNSPSNNPTSSPTYTPTTYIPTNIPSASPTNIPSVSPTNIPSQIPSSNPTINPSLFPSMVPTVSPTAAIPITAIPTSRSPTNYPSTNPSTNPSSTPSTATSSVFPSDTITTAIPSLYTTTSHPTNQPKVQTPTSLPHPSNTPTSTPALVEGKAADSDTSTTPMATNRDITDSQSQQKSGFLTPKRLLYVIAFTVICVIIGCLLMIIMKLKKNRENDIKNHMLSHASAALQMSTTKGTNGNLPTMTPKTNKMYVPSGSMYLGDGERAIRKSTDVSDIMTDILEVGTTSNPYRVRGSVNMSMELNEIVVPHLNKPLPISPVPQKSNDDDDIEGDKVTRMVAELPQNDNAESDSDDKGDQSPLVAISPLPQDDNDEMYEAQQVVMQTKGYFG